MTATTPCHLCGRALTGSRSTGRGYGPTCLRRIHHAILTADLDAYPPHLLIKAVELIADRGIVHDDDGVYLAVSSCGQLVYEVDPGHEACSCPAGTNGVRCYHLAAATILTAAWATRRAYV